MLLRIKASPNTYSLCDIVDNDSTVGVAVVHWCEGLVSFLTRRIPYFELDGCVVI